MTTRTTLPAAAQVAALTAARPLTTGNLLADCERWCRDHFPHRGSSTPPRRATAGSRRTAGRGRSASELGTGGAR